MNDEETKCVLCGKLESADTKTDFLRECYMMGQGTDDKPIWDKGLMQPRLNFIELGKINQRGYNYICHNRDKCRNRQAKNAQRKKVKEMQDALRPINSSTL